MADDVRSTAGSGGPGTLRRWHGDHWRILLVDVVQAFGGRPRTVAASDVLSPVVGNRVGMVTVAVGLGSFPACSPSGSLVW